MMYMLKKGGTVCSARNCKNKQYTSKESFFTFPKNIQRARLWVEACCREDLLERVDTLHKSHRICGVHFEPRMFLNDLRNRLQSNAMPTLFPSLQTSLINAEHNYVAYSASTCNSNLLMYCTPEQIVDTNKAENFQIVQSQDYWKIVQVEKSSNGLRQGQLPDQAVYVLENITRAPSDAASRILPPLHLNIPDPAIEDLTTFSSTSSTQTSVYLSAHSPRKERYRQKIKSLQRQNHRLQKKVESLTARLENLDHITLEQYIDLTYKFCPSEELADFINSEISSPKTKQLHKRIKQVNIPQLIILTQNQELPENL